MSVHVGRSLAPVLSLALATAGCAPSLALRQVQAVAAKPSSVSVLFTVEGPDGPVSDLPATSFVITEDGVPVAAAQHSVAVPDFRDHVRILLLLDIGGQPSAAEREAMADAAQRVTEGWADFGHVAVYAFDGAAKPRVLVKANASSAEAARAVEALRKDKARDESTDLHGALLTAVKTLGLSRDGSQRKIGVLVLVSRGPDRAARVSREAIAEEVAALGLELVVLAIGLGPDAPHAGLEALATTAPAYVASPAELGASLEGTRRELETRLRSYYLLSYCSGARAGEHSLGIEATRSRIDEDGATIEERGHTAYSFSAADFGPGCAVRRRAAGASGKPRLSR